MKTSNKILLGMVIVVFTVPLLLAAALQSKIKKGIYTVEKNDNSSPEKISSGSFTAAKVVKIVAPNPDLLTCHLKPADTMSYSYYKGESNDSVKVFTSSDTLYIMYIDMQKKTTKNGNSNNDNFEINVNLPAFNNVIVDGAQVILDSFAASAGTLSVTLKNKGVIKDGSENKEKSVSKELPAAVIKKEHPVPVSAVFRQAAATGNSNIANKRISDKEVVTVDIREYLLYRFL